METSCRPFWPSDVLDLHPPRFGGPRTSEVLLEGLGVSGDDRVVEMWPGHGCTTRKILPLRPRSYRGITADADAADRLDGALRRAPDLGTLLTRLEEDGAYTGFESAPPEATGLPDASANVVFGESLLTPLTPGDKRAVLMEAARLLPPGGRFGVHELCLVPDPSWDNEADARIAERIAEEFSASAGSQLAPLRESEWHRLITDAGLVVTATRTGPLEVPTLRTLIRDVGLAEFIKGLPGRAFHWSALRCLRELSYLLARRSEHLGAIVIVAERPLIGDRLLPDN